MRTKAVGNPESGLPADGYGVPGNGDGLIHLPPGRTTTLGINMSVVVGRSLEKRYGDDLVFTGLDFAIGQGRPHRPGRTERQRQVVAAEGHRGVLTTTLTGG